MGLQRSVLIAVAGPVGRPLYMHAPFRRAHIAVRESNRDPPYITPGSRRIGARTGAGAAGAFHRALFEGGSKDARKRYATVVRRRPLRAALATRRCSAALTANE